MIWKKDKTSKIRTDDEANPNEEYIKKKYGIADAMLLSISYIAGKDNTYVTYGFDIVFTNDQIGVFGVHGRGSGLGQADRDPRLPMKLMDSKYIVPQIGASVYLGSVSGKQLQVDVRNYKGPALVKGGALGPFGIEYFESVDVNSGIPNADVNGVAIGTGYSLFPVEYHDLYTDAYFWFSVGD